MTGAAPGAVKYGADEWVPNDHDPRADVAADVRAFLRRPGWARCAEPRMGWEVYKADILRALEIIMPTRPRNRITQEAVAAYDAAVIAEPGDDPEYWPSHLAEEIAGYMPQRAGLCRAVPDGDFLWRPPEDGETALDAACVAVWEGDCAVDVIAYAPKRPELYRSRTGLVDAIGERAIDDAAFDRKPLRLHDMPASWLASDQKGACILRWAQADFWRRLERVPDVICDDRGHAERVHKLTRRPVKRDLPTIHVATGRAG